LGIIESTPAQPAATFMNMFIRQRQKRKLAESKQHTNKHSSNTPASNVLFAANFVKFANQRNILSSLDFCLWAVMADLDYSNSVLYGSPCSLSVCSFAARSELTRQSCSAATVTVILSYTSADIVPAKV